MSRTDSIAYRGYKFPKTIGSYVAPDCLPELASKLVQQGYAPTPTPADQAEPRIDMGGGVVVSDKSVKVFYMETGLTATTPRPRPEVMCERSETDRADAIAVEVVPYSSPQAAQAAWDKGMAANAEQSKDLPDFRMEQVGQSQCVTKELMCQQLRDVSIYSAYWNNPAATDYSGWRVPTVADVAQISEGIAAAQ